jgi:catechol 2,3-dioxygenase-like lactoylglutathione lyase family enzyme
MKITTVLYMDAIEPALAFWVDRLGFTKAVEVPEGDRLGFVILHHGSSELMLQTRESVGKDMPQLLDLAVPRGGVYVEVDDFDDVLRRVEGLDVVLPERKTFYGMRETMVREPGGNLICFAGKL